MNTEGSISRGEELQALKRRAKDVEGRLHLLMKQLRELEYGLAHSTYQAIVEAEKCVLCGTCRDLCPTGAVTLDRIVRIDPARCTGCGYCVEACPQGAIGLRPVKRISG